MSVCVTGVLANLLRDLQIHIRLSRVRAVVDVTFEFVTFSLELWLPRHRLLKSTAAISLLIPLVRRFGDFVVCRRLLRYLERHLLGLVSFPGSLVTGGIDIHTHDKVFNLKC
jgi:hypothetical protein